MERIIATELRLDLTRSLRDAERYLARQGEIVNAQKLLRQETRRLDKELSELNKRAARGDTEAVELAKERGRQIARNKTQLRELSRAQREVNKDIDAVRRGVSSYKNLNDELSKLRDRIKNVQASGGIVDRRDIRRLQQLDQRLKKIDQSVGQYTRSVGDYRSALSGLGNTIRNGLFAAGLTVGISELTQGVSTAINTFAEFDKQIALLGAISNATEEDLAALEAEAKRLGETTFFTASQVAELQTNFARGGFSPDEIIAVTEATLDLAVATGEDLDSASRVVASNIRAFGLEASDAANFTDILTKTLNRSNQELGDFSEASKELAPTAKLLGISAEETSAAIGILADNGLRGTAATTTLSTSLIRLSDESKKYARAANELGVEVFNQNGEFVGLAQLLENVNEATADFTDEQRGAAVAQIFGIQAARNFNILLNAQKEVVTENGKEFLTGADALRGFTEELEGASGAAAEAANQVGDTLFGDFRRFTSALEGFQIRIVSAFEKPLRVVTQFATSLITGLGNALAFIGRAFAPVVDAVKGFLAELFEGSRAGELFNSALAFIGNSLILVGNLVASAIRGFTIFIDTIKNVIDAIPFLSNAITFVQDAFLGLIDSIAKVPAFLNGVVQGYKQFVSNVRNLDFSESITDAFTKGFNASEQFRKKQEETAKELAKTQNAANETASSLFDFSEATGSASDSMDKLKTDAAVANTSFAALRKTVSDLKKEIEEAPDVAARINAYDRLAEAEETLRKAEEDTNRALRQRDRDLQEEAGISTDLAPLPSQSISQIAPDQDPRIANEEAVQGLITDIVKKANAERQEDSEKSFQETIKSNQDLINGFEKASGQLISIISDFNQARLNRETAALESELERRLAAVEGNEEAEQEVREEFEQRREDIEREAAERQRNIALAQAFVNGALAITKVFGSTTPPLSFVLAALTAAQTAAQIAVISSQQFADGGLIDGPSHAQGGVKGVVRSTGQHIEAEGGEAFLNKRAMASNKVVKAEGTPREIASALNTIGGGIRFAKKPRVFEIMGSAAPYQFPTMPTPSYPVYFQNGGLVPSESEREAQVITITAPVLSRSQMQELATMFGDQIEARTPNDVLVVDRVTEEQQRQTEIVNQSFIN